MNDAELAICSRIRAFREHIKWSQGAFAAEMGVSREMLANVEGGWTPLRYDLAERICTRFNVTEVWLATGSVNPLSPISFADEVKQAVPPRALFSVAFSQYLRPYISAAQKRVLESIGPTGIRLEFPPVGQHPKQRWRWMLQQEVLVQIAEVPLAQQPDFAQALLEAMDRFCVERGLKRKRTGLIRPRDWPKTRPVEVSSPADVIAKALAAEKAGGGSFSDCKLLVDTPAASVTMAGVSSEIPTWKQVVAALNRLTKSTGAKSQLADDLDTSRQNVNKWLSGAGAPSAELTLEVFRWVEKHGGWKPK